MQYFKPEEPDLFVGDPMPFWHDGRFHLFWLLDRGHHAWNNGLGGHQWAHSSTADLLHWEHHPLAIALGGPGEADSGSVCTGSVIEHAGVFYAFYAGRFRHDDGAITQHLCLATSGDCVHFTKRPDNPILNAPPGYSAADFRDPCLFRDESGLFHMLVTAELADGPPHAERFGGGLGLPGRRGALAHFRSADLEHWDLQAPFLVPGLPGVPECPDYFRWGEWHYLTFLCGGQARYRMSRQPFGPWLRPPVETFDGRWASAIKTGAFGPEPARRGAGVSTAISAAGKMPAPRRLAVGFVPWRKDGRDDGHAQWGGNAVFRELVQAGDGTLGAKFPEEMVPSAGPPVPLSFATLSGQVDAFSDGARLSAPEGTTVAMAEGIPLDGRITCRVEPEPGAAAFGLTVRGSGCFEQGYEIRFSPAERLVSVRNPRKPWVGVPAAEALTAVDGLDRPFSADVVLHGDIMDLCVGGRRCLVSRFPELQGDRLFLFAENGAVRFLTRVSHQRAAPPTLSS